MLEAKKRTMKRRVPPQRRRVSQLQIPGQRSLLPSFTFHNYSILVFLLVFLAFARSIYQHFFQPSVQTDCRWLLKPPMVCAHGGDSSRAPPNTRAAYELAIDAGVDCIEIDASRTLDGLFVALHDRDLQEMSQRTGVRVGDMTAEEISKMDPAMSLSRNFPEQRVPTVEDAIEYVQDFLTQIIIDAKVGPPRFDEGISKELISLVERIKCRQCLVWAKEDKVVAEMSRLSVTTKTGYIVFNDTTTGNVSEPLRFNVGDVVGIYYGLVTSKIVNFLHRAGKSVYAWTVNNGDAMIEMLEANVDAIVTNDPRLLQQVMREQRQQCIMEGFVAF